ncbi:hypothetical protein QTN47_27465 [Danxiaibacter flavus]|uniref:Uncharacterized protein n=1 Tax=Danxiaibacter flavus TaxID=3049108 RepID=A0ABV3ZQN4_9BACT|nr:hypothetical protein QNM32_27465 [Chitinophagaceae bacterium DXS]
MKKSFKDPFKTRVSTLVLNPDKLATSNTNDYPIIWVGWVGIQMVKIIQIGPSAIHESFVFEVFPEEYVFLKNTIVRWIRDSLNGPELENS